MKRFEVPEDILTELIFNSSIPVSKIEIDLRIKEIPPGATREQVNKVLVNHVRCPARREAMLDQIFGADNEP